ncbi:MAG: hypothetical protein JWO05_3133 [Gemmatimonadetes bacterium]|nr:hypothetical protein [Gemmatimonadota bacterium]
MVEALRCDACGLCVALCPPSAIVMRREGLVVDAETCTGCRKCIAPCPVSALVMIPLAASPSATIGGPAS